MTNKELLEAILKTAKKDDEKETATNKELLKAILKMQNLMENQAKEKQKKQNQKQLKMKGVGKKS